MQKFKTKETALTSTKRKKMLNVLIARISLVVVFFLQKVVFDLKTITENEKNERKCP